MSEASPTPVAMTPNLAALLDRAAAGRGRLVMLTGAGISAESGIPTFRGKEGFWTVGSRVYRPQELATFAMFSRDPGTVWPWYLWRRARCRAAEPNAAHRALVALEAAVPDRFVLVTQNVDGLHRRAGQSAARTWEIHGNIDTMRCAAECGAPRVPVPPLFDVWDTDGLALEPAHREALRCGRCGAWQRPHVLWFDEMYDEERYRYQSSIAAVSGADLLLVVGTAGMTTLPSLMARQAARSGVPIVDVNPDDNPFAELAQQTRGVAVRGTAGANVPGIAARLAMA